MPRPAEPPDTLDDYLRPAGEAPALWAEFDPAWYLATYPEARDELGEEAPFAVVRAWYLRHGQPARHSPVLWFDEGWYRTANPDLAEALASGVWRSGFEHYCLEGSTERSPHWLYDEALYRARNPDLADEALAAAGCFNRYDHYLRDGARAGRIAHLLFDAGFYAALHADDPLLAELGPWGHALTALRAEGAEPRTSPCFDPGWYRGFYPEAARPPYQGALHHYLTNPTPTAFDPLIDFVDSYYLAANPDVAAEVRAGRLRNGYEHFLTNGAAERRAPAPWIDLSHYAAHPAVAAALAAGAVPHAFLHLLAHAQDLGLTLSPDAGGARARALAPLLGRGRLDFRIEEGAGQAVLSAIVTLPAERARAALALAALRAEVAGNVELLLLARGADAAGIAAAIPGARLLDGAAQAGGRAAAIAAASAPLLLFLDAGYEPLPGAIAAGLRRLAMDPGCGAVGGPTFDAGGRLIEAGLAVFSDASTAPCLAGGSARSPAAGALRSPDACTTTLLLARRAAVAAASPDPAIPPGWLADADLCLGVWGLGSRVVYDPAVAVLCDDARAARLATPPDGRELLAARHPLYLARRPAPQPLPPSRCSPIEAPERVLVIAASVAAGKPALDALIADGAEVTLYPLDGGGDPASLPAGIGDAARIVCGPGLDGLEAFVALRRAEFTRIDQLVALPFALH